MNTQTVTPNCANRPLLSEFRNFVALVSDFEDCWTRFDVAASTQKEAFDEAEALANELHIEIKKIELFDPVL